MAWEIENPSEFYTYDRVPPNRLVRVGDSVKVPSGRQVVRIGYPLTIASQMGEASDLYRSPEGQKAVFALAKVCGFSGGDELSEFMGYRLPWRVEKDIQLVMAKTLLRAKRYGGNDRGAEVRTGNPGSGIVLAKRTAVVGTYHPGAGGGEDYDSPYLAPRITVVLVHVQGFGWAFSGDAEELEEST